MLQLQRGKHLIVENGLSRFLEHEFPGKDTFVYRHLKEESFVICRWLNKIQGTVEELLVLNGDIGLERGTLDLLRKLLLIPAQVRIRELKQGIRDEEASAANEYDRDIEERREEARFMRQKLNKVKRDHPLLVATAGGF